MEKIKGTVKVRKLIEPKGETKLARHGRYSPKKKVFKVSVKHRRLYNGWYQENSHKVAFEEKGKKGKSTHLL